MSSSEPLIHLADVKKVFYTDEVETHALSGIHLDITPAITHRFGFREHEAAFAAARTGSSGKVVMDWTA